MWRLVWWMGLLKYYINFGILLNRKFQPVLSAKSKWSLFLIITPENQWWNLILFTQCTFFVFCAFMLCGSMSMRMSWFSVGWRGRGEVFGNYVALQTKVFQINRHHSILVNLTMQLSTSFPGKVTGRNDCGWQLWRLLEHGSSLKALKELARSTNHQWKCLWYSLNSLFMNDWYFVPTVASCSHAKLRFWLSDETQWKSCP